MHPRTDTPADLDAVAQASVLIEDAQALLQGAGPPLVAAHLQYALDLLRGESRLIAGSLPARRIELWFGRATDLRDAG